MAIKAWIGGLALIWSSMGVASPRFDHYLLALSVATAFCEDRPVRAGKLAQCRDLNEASFKALPLTLHGLWPSRLDRRHPVFCGGRAGESFCAIRPLRLQSDTRSRLDRAMPGTADCLDRYQWAKHGSCSNMAVGDYFAVSVALTERVNRALGAELARHMGREVKLDTLRTALAKHDPALLDAVVFDCRTPNTPHPAKRRPMLWEVRVAFERDPASGAPGKPLDFRNVGHRHFNSGCPKGRAYVDTPLD